MGINTLLIHRLGIANATPGRLKMEMRARPKKPSHLTDFKGNAPRVRITREPKDEADRVATQALLLAYTDKDGFRCPKCGVVITNPDEAVEHLGEEINKTLDWLNSQAK